MLYITIDERGNMGLAARQFEIDAVTLPVGNCDDDRFKRLVDEHRDAIVRYFFRRLPRAVVIDAVADTFALVREQMPWKARESDELLRLYSVAYAVARERTAAPIACPACGTAVDVVEHGNRTHSIATEQSELLSVVDGLDELDREMLRLLAWDRLSIAQIAAVTGLSRSAAGRRLDAVTERLNEQSPGIAGNADDRLWMPSGVVS